MHLMRSHQTLSHRRCLGLVAAAVGAALLPLATLHGAVTADFFVAPNGDDANPGTKRKPFATLARARNAVREKVAAGLDRSWLVFVRGGTYPQTQALVFGPEDSGTERHSITYAAAPGESVVLDGGRRISRWKKGKNEVWTADLPEVRSGNWYFRQLFVKDRRAVRAIPRLLTQVGWGIQRARPERN